MLAHRFGHGGVGPGFCPLRVGAEALRQGMGCYKVVDAGGAVGWREVGEFGGGRRGAEEEGRESL